MVVHGISPDGMTDLVRALELIHNPTSSNELRRQALTFLEAQKESKLAARNGFLLVSRNDNPALVRYFGLTLLDHVLRHTSFDSPALIVDLKGMIVQLAEAIRPEDPPFLRNKISQLWVEVAKRAWGLSWVDMDELLVKFWAARLVHKEFVLAVLETLSEDVFYREDTVSSLRGTDLNRALVEVFNPLSVFEETFPKREHHVELRCGSEGWLSRICGFLASCVENLPNSQEARDSALKALATLRSVMSWSFPKAILSSQCVPVIFRTFVSQDDQILLVSVMLRALL